MESLYRLRSEKNIPSKFGTTEATITKDGSILWRVRLNRLKEEFSFEAIDGDPVSFSHKYEYLFIKRTTLHVNSKEICTFTKRKTIIGNKELRLNGKDQVTEDNDYICGIDRPYRNETDKDVRLRWKLSRNEYEIPVAYYACLTWVDPDRF